MKVIGKLCLLAFLISLLSCKDKKENNSSDDSELRYQYFRMADNGWKSRKYSQNVDDIAFTATQVPLQYYILKEIGAENLHAVDSVYKENERERIIEFEFYQDDEQDLLKEKFTGLDYTESVKYMSFSLEKDFYAVTSKKDTIPCSGLTFERNFKIAPYHKVILFFTNIDPNDDIQLVYHDKLFKKGILKFNLSEKITKPKL